MKIAFVYAGQGSQYVGMGKDLYEKYPTFRKAYDEAPVDFDLKTLCLEGPEEKLKQTRYTQPCMVAFAVGMTDLLEEAGIQPEMAAGLSLGEYSALYAAGALNRKSVVELVAFRGKAMEEAAGDGEYGMQACLNIGREALQSACDEASDAGLVVICNYNCPGQLVISGEKAAVEKAAALALEKGARRCIPLKVSGPFHTPFMKPAGDALRERFRTVEFGELQFPVIFNAIGRAKTAEETIPELLEKQVQSSVWFEDSIRYMESQGIDTVVEIGPGKALSGFIKKTTKNIKTYVVEDAASLEAVVSELKGAKE